MHATYIGDQGGCSELQGVNKEDSDIETLHLLDLKRLKKIRTSIATRG